MVKAMRYRDLKRALLNRIVSPGVVRDTIAKLACLPKGWLQ